jgi:AcrR family transcriptional regulator
MDQGTHSLRERRKLQTRLDIIRAGIELFLEFGVDEVPVEVICEQAGVSRATFFNYFPHKDLILAEMVLSRIEHVRQILQRHTTRKQPATLNEIIGILLRFAAANEDLGEAGRRVFVQMLMRPVCHPAHVQMRRQMVAALTKLVEQMKRHGPLKRTRHTARAIAETLFAIYMATSFEWLIDEKLPRGWLVKNLKPRLQVALRGIAA